MRTTAWVLVDRATVCLIEQAVGFPGCWGRVSAPPAVSVAVDRIVLAPAPAGLLCRFIPRPASGPKS